MLPAFFACGTAPGVHPANARPPLPAAVVSRSFAQHATTMFFPHLFLRALLIAWVLSALAMTAARAWASLGQRWVVAEEALV